MVPNIDAKDAIVKAQVFLEDYHNSFRLISAMLNEGEWIIICDIGFLNEEIKKVRVDAISGKILGLIDVSKD